MFHFSFALSHEILNNYRATNIVGQADYLSKELLKREKDYWKKKTIEDLQRIRMMKEELLVLKQMEEEYDKQSIRLQEEEEERLKADALNDINPEDDFRMSVTTAAAMNQMKKK